MRASSSSKRFRPEAHPIGVIVGRAATRPVTGLWITVLTSGAAVSLLVGPTVLLHPFSSAVGINPASDFQVMTWSLEWWPWAVLHGLDPFHARLLWPPEGFSTLWMTSIPAPALLALPITLTAGPLLAYNVLMLAAVPLASGAAYLLCRELTGRLAPSLVGGLLFGLSPYMLGHTLSQHLDLTFVFPVPLLALLVVRCARGKTTARRFVAGFAALLLLQFGASFELFVDLTIVVAVGLILELLRGATRRGVVLRTARLVGLAYAACLPVLVATLALAFSTSHGPLRYAPSDFAVDAANVVVPTPTVLAGTLSSVRVVSRQFVGNIGEQDGYLGLPLVIIALLAMRGEWRRPTWLVGAIFVATILLSFGPVWSVGGWPVVRLPFSTADAPVLRDALPARMSMFSALAAACLCALWLARRRRGLVEWGGVAIVFALLFPNFWPAPRLAGAWATSDAFGWSSPHISAAFADDSAWMRLVRPGATVLVLPTADRTAAGYWQAWSAMEFALAVPVTPFVPPGIVGDPTVVGLADDVLPVDGRPLASARLRSFLRADHVAAVVVTRAAGRRWRRIAASATGTRPLTVDGDSVYRIPAKLRQLSGIGDVVVARAAGAGRRSKPLAQASVTIWLRFQGNRAVPRVLYRSRRGRAGHERAITLASANGDAAATAAAVGNGARAAVAFTEWRSHSERLRAATRRDGRWRTTTLDTDTQPIWSPHVVITPDGTTVAAWIDESDPLREVRVAVLPPGGRWQRPLTLETGEGFGTVTLGAAARGEAVCAWRDSVASEERIRVATYDSNGWTDAATLAATESRLGRISLGGANATLLRWHVENPVTGATATSRARRDGSRWISLANT
jgi:hypothetical protein